MDFLSTYNLLIAASSVIILSFFFGELAKKTNVPSVLMLIVLGILLKFGIEAGGILGEEKSLEEIFLPYLKILGTVGVIMIVLEAALELKLEREKYWFIAKALAIALICLMASTWVAALILEHFIDGMDMQMAWIYATPLSILSSAIIIPSVSGLEPKKKEFHIYESTFSDILGIMLFYYLTGNVDPEHSGGMSEFGVTTLLTLVISFVASYLIIFIFQNIKSHAKLFLLIAVLLLLYSVAKQYHLSSLLIILIFGLIIANRHLFFRGKLGQYLHMEEVAHMYEGLHTITLESAFVVRTFFFVIFGITITLSSLMDWNVAMISLLIIASIYIIRWILLALFFGRDIIPQVFIGPRGLITVLLFYSIPKELNVPGFEKGILLFVIIVTSIIMTWALVRDKSKRSKLLQRAKSNPVSNSKWKAPSITPNTPSNKHEDH